MRILIVIILMLLTALAHGQTHTMPGSNVVPSGASLTINSGASITAAAGSTVTGFGSGGGGTPGGSNTQLQYNNGGAFGGVPQLIWDGSTVQVTSNQSSGRTPLILNNTSGTSKSSVLNFFNGATALWTFANDSTVNGAQDFFIYDNVNTRAAFYIGTDAHIGLPSISMLGWAATANANAALDTALYRNAAGVVEVNNGTAGTFRDLKARTVNATTGFQLNGAEFPIASNGLVKRTAANTYAAAVSATDYAPATSGSSILYGNGSGGFSNATVSTGLTFSAGTLSVTAGTYQAADTDLTTWAGVTPTSGIQTWLATPSSANLRAAVTDENGTGALLFSGATTPDFTTGFTIGAAAASGKILVGNGTNFVPSTPTYPNAASPTARKFIVSDGTNWTASTETQAVPGTSGNLLTSDGTNWTSAAPVVTTSNTVTFTNKRITKRSLALAAPTPAPSVNADNTDVVHITGLTGAITSITMTGTPVEGDTLRIDFTDNGTARAITLGASFEAGAAPLPTTTVISTRLDTVFYWNTVTSKWRCMASNASPTYPATAGTVGTVLTSDGTNWISNGLPRMTLTSTVDQTATAIQAHMTYTVPANTAQIGTVYHVHAFGNIDNGTTAITYTFNALWGGTGGVTMNTIAFAGTTTSNTNRQWVYDGTLTIRTIGASGTGVAEGSLTERTTSTTGVEAAHVNNAGTTALVLDTTINKDLVLTWTLSATTGTPHVRTIGGYAELVK